SRRAYARAVVWRRFGSALLRMRLNRPSPSHGLKQHTSPRSRGAFFAPGFLFLASLIPIEGWAERRETFGCLRDTRWARSIASKTRVNALMTQRCQAPSEAPCVP